MKVLIRVDSDSNGMFYHRLYTPFNKIEGVSSTPMVEEKGKKKYVMARSIPKDVYKDFSAVIFSRSIEMDGTTKETVDYLHDCGCKVVLDIDDYWHVEKNHGLYNTAKKLAKNTEDAIKYSDLVFTPTPFLTDECAKLNKNTYTIKTCIDKSHHQWSTPTISSPLVRFGWLGGIYHKGDVAILENSITKLHKECTGYQICLGGFHSYKFNYRKESNGKVYDCVGLQNGFYYEVEKNFTNNHKVLEKEYMDFLNEFTPPYPVAGINGILPDHISYFKPYRRLWSKPIDQYATLYDEIDISLVPLSGLGNFNKFKSELKLIEAGTKGKMAIVSKVKPYTLVPDECVHFVDKSDNGGWYYAMRYCLDNPNYVKEKSEALSKYIEKNYNLEAENKKRVELIKSIL